MNKYIYILLSVLVLMTGTAAAQPDKRDVRRGNRDYRKGNFKEAEIEYRKGIVKDSLSVAANYNLAADLYRQNNSQEAQKVLDRIKEVAPASANAADYYYNLGDVAIANQDWQSAVTAFEQSLLLNPDDMEAKENYIYAKKKLQDQQNQQQNQQQNDQNQDQNKDNQQNDQNQNQDQNKNDQNQSDQNKDQNKQNQGQQPQITPQAAQQMLQAIQAKEKETQEKVNKEKAKALQSRQKERNW